MADQAERVVLEAEDQVNPVVDKANAGLDSFEKKAESAHGKVIRITDQTRSSVQRLIASLEKQAETYGKSGVERLISQRDQLLQRYAKEPAAIDAITRSYERMIAVEEKAAREAAAAKAAKEVEEALKRQTESIKTFGDRIGQFIENPIQGAKGAIGSLLSSMGPFGVGIMAGATALAGFGVAAFEAAKSLGEYGTRVKDAELRTGLTAKEVGQFGFAAKAVGQDISVVERLMRGLSQAADENSREGEKARATLQRMGVDLHTAAGELKPTSEILIEISEGLNKLPEGLQRDAAAMDLFKRAGVEAIPFMTELNENLRIAHEQGFGPTEDDVRRFQEYQREVAQLETKWDALIRKFKEGIVITVSWVGKGVDWFLNNVGTAGDDERERREEEQARQEAEQVRSVGGYGASMSRGAHRQEVADLERRAPGIVKNREAIERQLADLRTQQQNLVGNFGWVQALAPTEEEQGRMRQAADIQKQIEQLQHELQAAEQATRRMDLRAGKEETDRLRARFFGTHEGMEKAYSDAKKDVERYQKELFEPEKPLSKSEVTDLAGKLHTAQATEARWKAALDAEKHQSEDLKEFRRQAAAFEKKGDEAELSAIEKIYRQRDLLLEQAARVKATEAEIADIRKSADEQAAVLQKKAADDFEKYDQQRRAEQSKTMMALFLPSKEQMKEWEDVFKAQERIEDIGVQAQREELRRRAGIQARSAQSPEEAYRIRVSLAVQLAQIEVARIEREDNAARRMVLAAEAQKDLYTELARAQDELEAKRAEAEQKRVEGLQRQVDELQKVSSGLLHTLFTKPGDFPKQLGGAIHEALLKPATEGLGGMVANAIHPLIYGGDGQGGLAGILHGAFGGAKQDPIAVTADNTTATKQNSDALWILTAVLAEFMGRSAPALTAHGTGSGIPNIGIATPSGFLMEMLRNTGSLPRFAEGGVTSGPTIVGEAGPELVVPMNRLRNFGLGSSPSLLVGHYGSETDAALQKAAMAGIDIGLPAGLAALGGPLALEAGDVLMSLLIGGVSAATPPRNDGVLLGIMPTGPQGGARFDPEPGKALFNKTTIEQLAAIGRKGGLRSGLARRMKALEQAEDRALSDAIYRGPEPGPIETTHDASQKLDAEFPWLADAFKKTEGQIRNQASGRAGGRVGGGDNRSASVRATRDVAAMRVTPGPGDPYYTVRWVINPKTGEIALTKIGKQYEYYDLLPEHHQLIASKGWPTSGRNYDLMHRGQASIARNGTVLDLGDQSGEGLAEFIATYGTRAGFRPISNDQAKQLLKAIGEQFSKGPSAIVRKLPSYDDGGTVGSTGLAMVHQGEAVVPQADTLKRSIDALTFEMHANTGVLGWFVNSMVQPMLGGRAPALPIRVPGVGTVTLPSLFGGGSDSAGTIIYAPAPVASASTGAAGEGGYSAAGGYSPVGGYTPAQWASGQGRAPSPVALASMASGRAGVPGSGFSPHAMLSNLKNTDWGGFTRNKAGGITGMHGVAGAAVFTGGTMLAEHGLMGSSAGTWGGVAEGTAGGAAVGFTMGGPLGAAIGAGVGFGIGIGEKIFGVKSLEQTAHDDIKSVYGVDIPANSGTVKQVVEIAKSQFGGSISVAVRSPNVRQLVMLYSEATGQKMPLSAATPYAGSLVEQGGSLYQQASFQNNAWHMYASNLPTLGGIAGSTYPTTTGPSTAAGSGATYLSLHISGADAANFMTGQYVTPQFVTDQAMAAQYSSYGRTQQSANMQLPGLTVA